MAAPTTLGFSTSLTDVTDDSVSLRMDDDERLAFDQTE